MQGWEWSANCSSVRHSRDALVSGSANLWLAHKRHPLTWAVDQAMVKKSSRQTSSNLHTRREGRVVVVAGGIRLSDDAVQVLGVLCRVRQLRPEDHGKRQVITHVVGLDPLGELGVRLHYLSLEF